ncbi:MAG: ABC transporter permease [Candidatus Thermoplasmatota archaeon]|jgi:ABC-2 type transport system permease protein|nr:ABC transporter permease [Candidatus Thermoplasmatota archaeon]
MRFVQHAISDSLGEIYSDQYNDYGTNVSQMMEQLMSEMIENGTGGITLSKNVNVTANVVIKGDPASSSYFTVSGIIQGSMEAYVDNSGKIALAISAKSLPVKIDPGSQEPYVFVEDRSLDVSDLSSFDYQVPGIIVFALLMSATGVCISLSREESKGTLTRLKLTKMSSFDMLFGSTIPYTIIAVAQLFILLCIALLMGYQFNPDANIFLALFIAIWGCLATVALGLILAAIAKNEDQAGYLGPMVAVPLSFLTGAFFSLPTITFTENFLGTGKSFELFDWLPWTQCGKALTKTMTYGASFGDVLVEIVIMIILTAVLFTLGVILYHRKRLRSI